MAVASDISELVAGGIPKTGEKLLTSPLRESHIVPLITSNLNKTLSLLLRLRRLLLPLISEKNSFFHELWNGCVFFKLLNSIINPYFKSIRT